MILAWESGTATNWRRCDAFPKEALCIGVTGGEGRGGWIEGMDGVEGIEGSDEIEEIEGIEG